MKRFLPLVGLFVAMFASTTTIHAQQTPDQIIAKQAAQNAADGAQWRPGRSPVFDAIVETQNHQLKVSASLGQPKAPSEATLMSAARSFLGCIPPKPMKAPLHSGVKRLATATEAQWDWRTKNGVTPIRNQGNCGSCWDFSGVGAIEMSYCIQSGADPKTVDFSEESVLSCGSNGGCGGDWPETVFAMAKTKGIANESDMPYKGMRQTCPNSLTFPNKVSDYGYVGTDSAVADTQAIKDAMKAYGPISCAVAADSAFMSYSSGVFSGGARGINHAIILVGWDDSTGSWILRNSWDTSWGESGYMRIKYGSNQVGYGAMWVKATFSGPAPSALTLTAVPTVGTVPMVASFTSNATGAVKLDFGDVTTPFSGTYAGPIAHTYSAAGTYTATITSGTQTAIAAITVSSSPIPPSPTPTTGFTGTITVTTTTVYTNGLAGQTTTSTSVSTSQPSKFLENDLKSAGVSPSIVLDVLQLVNDIKNKAGAQAIAKDVLQILTDLATPTPSDPTKTSGSEEGECCGRAIVAPDPMPASPAKIDPTILPKSNPFARVIPKSDVEEAPAPRRKMASYSDVWDRVSKGETVKVTINVPERDGFLAIDPATVPHVERMKGSWICDPSPDGKPEWTMSP